MFYDRKIKYMYVYEKGEKMQNAGFARLEVMEDKAKIHIQVSGLKPLKTGGYRIESRGRMGEKVLGEICLEHGKGEWDGVYLPEEQVAQDLAGDLVEEIRILLSPEYVLRCAIAQKREEVVLDKQEELLMETESFADLKMSEAELLKEAFLQERRMLEENVREEITVHEEAKVEPEKLAESEKRSVGESVKREEVWLPAADKWQELWTLYPHITPFEDNREYLLVHPRDFVILQKQHYVLSSNSFLLHGYYNYEHLILCREKKGDGEKYYIGVPGNFYDKEKQVAVLFGFESFEGKREPAGTGDFGYYMVGVEI